jgi:hypothetical protein
MDRRDVNRKLKIVEFQSNYSPVAPQYEYSGNIIREKNDVAIANGNKIALVLIYIAVFILAAMTKMYVTYEIGNLGAKKNTLETQLKEIKTEVEALDYNLIKNYNMKRAEEKARDLGFETIDNIRYINIK